jgi:methylated-DNA-[protein]-cysteine S-methyltransferase
MLRLLRLHYGKNGFHLQPERNPHGLSDAISRYFAGDLAAIDKIPVQTAGTHSRRCEQSPAARRFPIASSPNKSRAPQP